MLEYWNIGKKVRYDKLGFLFWVVGSEVLLCDSECLRRYIEEDNLISEIRHTRTDDARTTTDIDDYGRMDSFWVYLSFLRRQESSGFWLCWILGQARNDRN